MKTILVTGGAGFIGSNFIPYYLASNPDHKVINLDKLTYAGNLDNLKEIENHEQYVFVQGDICDQALLKDLWNQHQIEGVIHFAAESHVDNSIDGPETFIQTNINGTFNLLDQARNAWMEKPFEFKN